MRKAGWEIKRGKHIAQRAPGETRFKRLDKLGEGYTEEALRDILSGEKKHKPRTKLTPVQPTHRVSLLVDIQAKLRKDKGAGYERWANRFNKELANTLNFISEHGVADYDDLAAQTEAATEHANDLMASIRQAETRMSEIKMLETHIINYLKTKDVFAAYHASSIPTPLPLRMNRNLLCAEQQRQHSMNLACRSCRPSKCCVANTLNWSNKRNKPTGNWTAILEVDTKNKPRRRIMRHYAALLRISNGVRPVFISIRS